MASLLAHLSGRRATSPSARDYLESPIGVCVFGLIVLFGLAVFVATPLIYDEAPYLKPVALLHRYGLSLKFLEEYPEPTGILHNVIHWILEPVTELRPPLVRLVNPVLLILTIILTSLTLGLVGSFKPLASSLAFIGIPFTWVVAGMALTEMPAILLVSLSTYLLARAYKSESKETFAQAISWALIGGVTLGIAFLSRGMVLVVLAALPCLLLGDWRRSYRVVAAFAFGTAAVTGPIIAFWGGLVPPFSVVPVSITSISAFHFVLSFSYAATIMLILAPAWFSLNAQLTIGIFSAILGLNLIFGLIEIPVMRTAASYLPAVISSVVPRVAGSFMSALAVLFILSSLKHLRDRRFDSLWAFFCVSMLLLIAAPAKVVHGYSSRYTMMASGMMILTSDPFVVPNGWRNLRLAVGVLIGLASLLSYYYGST
jgi:4-amino-4-deoxy-L-arabinose transferase-like glycosyltransferase